MGFDQQQWRDDTRTTLDGTCAAISQTLGPVLLYRVTGTVGDNDAQAERPSASSVSEGLAACRLLFLLGDVVG